MLLNELKYHCSWVVQKELILVQNDRIIGCEKIIPLYLRQGMGYYFFSNYRKSLPSAYTK